MFASKPRFLDADPAETTDKIKILPPNRAKQDTYAFVHPVSTIYWAVLNHSRPAVHIIIIIIIIIILFLPLF